MHLGNYYMGVWWIIIPVIFLIVMFIMRSRTGFMGAWRDSRRGPSENEGSESALEILKKRYAKGEMSKEEYENMKKDLSS